MLLTNSLKKEYSFFVESTLYTKIYEYEIESIEILGSFGSYKVTFELFSR